MNQFSNKQKADEARREVGLRKYVYSGRVLQHKMTQQKADELISVMEEIAEDYRLLDLKDKESSGLFAGQ